jgi:exodeoxyribonuclease V beta subunit
MSILLDALHFPLHGSRLIEASAGTGKTWTIAALYLRLVLGNGGDDDYARALLPSEILVMTFTRAATRELANRVRERLVEAAAYFRGERASDDAYLAALAAACADASARARAAHRLLLAADSMDEAAIFTIDAWCQRMLREHAFDSGSLFDEELLGDESALFEDAAHDYWRQQVYPLEKALLAPLQLCWADVAALKGAVRELARRTALLPAAEPEPLRTLIAREESERRVVLATLKAGWEGHANAMERWIAEQRDLNPKAFNGNKLRAASLVQWFDGLRAWARDPALERPDITDTAWNRLTRGGIEDASKGLIDRIPDCFDRIEELREGLASLKPLKHALQAHAAASIAARMTELKARNGQFGFADMLDRLKAALEGPNGTALRARITTQYPIAMVDEFQDTSPDQYAIFNLLYRVADNDRALGLFLIGDPKQSIYGFRGADIHSYLAARSATEGRHYRLGTNHRSTQALVGAVNQLFMHAEGADGQGAPAQGDDAAGAPVGNYPGGAFRFRRPDGSNPLPFDAVDARGRAERFIAGGGEPAALQVGLCLADDLKADDYRAFFAHHCAEHIATLLNDPRAGFANGDAFTRLQPADIAILVRDRREAAAIRAALQRRRIASVYLSDKDSVLSSAEAGDVLRWLQALANPLDGGLARAAFATRTARLSLAELARLSSDELAWEARVEQLKTLHGVWQRQGVLAMLRRFIHALGLPAALLAEVGGERRLTNLLHLAELLQSASAQLDGEQSLIRWFAEQVAGMGDGEGGDERVLRLESDAELVKVVTVHKSKGLEYPLVYLPFAVSARKTDKRGRAFFEYVDKNGVRQLDLALSDVAFAAVERGRIEEDLRLLYVALTRARHQLWLGVAAVAALKKGENRLHDSALGYLLNGGAAIGVGELAARWEQLRGGHPAIGVVALDAPDRVTMLARADARPALVAAAPYRGQFERNWTVGSFTSITRQTSVAPMRAQDETVVEEAPRANLGVASARPEDAPWHRFPRGAMPGNFLHEQLEWMGQEGFGMIDDASFDARLAQRCERAGWGKRADDATAWLRRVASTPLGPLGAPLTALGGVLPEMEFWFPSEHLASGALDKLCRDHLLDGVARPGLPERALHGMLKGFADLVCEHDGRYWVIDYKSNALGAGDAAYSRANMAVGMAAHRYDIQGALYMLALHRLLRTRLGDAYDPARQLGGALFLFLRGIAHPHTQGCYHLAPDLALLDGLDALLADARAADFHPVDSETYP